jgi:two-component system response regulator HupR/HoxA
MIGMMNAPDTASADAPHGGKDAVLIIDDEKPLLEVYAAALSPHFDVSTATSTKEAELFLRQKKFKVVVSDHLMPGGNGMNLLVRVREEYPEMQRVLVTAYMKPEMLLRSVNEAALFRYLLKPISLAELIKVVQEAIKLHDQTIRAAATS